MADRKALEAALIQADHDGDEDAVKTLMAEINKQDGYKEPSTLAQYGRSLLNSAARPVVSAVNALPALAQDMGVSARNLAQRGLHAAAPGLEKTIYDTNAKLISASGNNRLLDAVLPTSSEQYEMPSAIYQRAIDEKFAPPPTTAGKVAEFGNTLLAGGLMPNPTVASGLPAAVKTAQEAELAHKLGILKAAQAKGAVVPPATVNPTYTNRMMESLAGKYATAQDASVRNAENFTNPLAREALSAPSNSILDKTTLDTMRNYAGQAYDAVRKAGVFTAPKSYMQTLDSVVGDATKAARSFPEIGNTLGGEEIAKAVNMAKGNAAGVPGSRPKINTDDAVSAIKVLREKAVDAYASGQHSVGAAYKKIATAMEDAIEQGLIDKGKPGAQMLKDFRGARQQIAKIFNVLEASNPVTGDVSAKALGQQLNAGVPLTGPLKEAARFGAAFPKEGRLLNESVGVNQLTANMGVLAAKSSGEEGASKYAMVGLPVLGGIIRNALLSGTGQRLLTNRTIGPGLLGSSVSNPVVMPASFYGTKNILGESPKKKKEEDEQDSR